MHRKWLALLAAAALGLLACYPSVADGVTLRTISTFAGTDAAAETYVNLLKAWEEETGNKVEDSSSTGDEAFKGGLLNDFAAGNEADVIFYYACTSDSKPILRKVVPIEEINAAYPDLNLPVDPVLAEADGTVYAIPVRSYWEGLVCNVDLFEQVGVELPTDWEKLLVAIEKFKEAGIVPIAASFSDIPHYVAEATILSASSAADYQASPQTLDELPDSWLEGTRLIRTLCELGAFPDNVNATSEAVTSQMFRDKRAAMQIDGSWFANGIPEANWDSTIFLPFPAVGADAHPNAVIAGASMGFYISKKAWSDPARRDAAVDLLAHLTTGDNAPALSAFSFGGKLYQSSLEMLERSGECQYKPIQDRMDPQARQVWFSSIPRIADGSLSAEEAWAQIFSAALPFGE